MADTIKISDDFALNDSNVAASTTATYALSKKIGGGGGGGGNTDIVSLKSRVSILENAVEELESFYKSYNSYDKWIGYSIIQKGPRILFLTPIIDLYYKTTWIWFSIITGKYGTIEETNDSFATYIDTTEDDVIFAIIQSIQRPA